MLSRSNEGHQDLVNALQQTIQQTVQASVQAAIQPFAQDTASRFDHLNTRLDGLEHRFDGLENHFSVLENRFGILENRQSKFEIADINARLFAVNGAGSLQPPLDVQSGDAIPDFPVTLLQLYELDGTLTLSHLHLSLLILWG